MKFIKILSYALIMAIGLLIVGCGNQNNVSQRSVENSEKQVEKAVEVDELIKKSMSDLKETAVEVKQAMEETQAAKAVDKGSLDELKLAEVKKVQAANTSKKKINTKPAAPGMEIKIEEKVLVSNEVSKVKPVEKPSTTVVEEKIVEEVPAEIAQAKPDHSAWNTLLQKHVSGSGNVNYSAIVKEKAALEAYCQDLSAHPIASDWSRGEKMAYWINAYNAFTIKLIADNYPVAKITDLEGGKPWDKKWIKLGAKTYSLNQIENDILRPVYKEPRIHFAVNCAAKSCPPLLNMAWTAGNLEANFVKQTKAFINNSQYNQISGRDVKLSKIFEWYGEDFGNLRSYINKYAGTKIGADISIGFMEYDWNLNK